MSGQSSAIWPPPPSFSFRNGQGRGPARSWALRTRADTAIRRIEWEAQCNAMHLTNCFLGSTILLPKSVSLNPPLLLAFRILVDFGEKDPLFLLQHFYRIIIEYCRGEERRVNNLRMRRGNTAPGVVPDSRWSLPQYGKGKSVMTRYR